MTNSWQFKVVHATTTRVRVKLPFRCTPNVQQYLNELGSSYGKIEKIHFYADETHMAFHFKENGKGEVSAFLNHIDPERLKQCYLDPVQIRSESIYTIVSNSLYKRFLIKALVPKPVQMLMTTYQSLHFAKSAFQSLKQKRLDMEVLDFLAISTSLVRGDSETAGSIIHLLNLGKKLDAWTEKRSISELEKSLQSKASSVWVLDQGKREEKQLHTIKLGDTIILSEGSEIYFDGVVTDGKASVNESSLTGESYPVSKRQGDQVYSNTVMEAGEVLVKVENEQPNSRINHIIKLIKQSERNQSEKERNLLVKADKLVKYNFLGMGLTFLFTRSFTKTLSFLLVDFSCVLKLSTPITYLSAMKAALQQNIVIKGSNYIDMYPEIDTFVFDKTGTLTTTEPEVKEIIPFHEYTQKDVLWVGACLEEHIYHPLAQAVVQKAEDEGIVHEEMHGQLYHIASKGVKSTIDNDKVVIGSKEFVQDEGMQLGDEQLEICHSYSKKYKLLYLGYKDKVIAIFCIDTPLRREAEEVLTTLKEKGKRLVLLTGDEKDRVRDIEKLIPFDEVHTEVKPKEKYTYIGEQQKKGHKVLMVGDGLNDSAAISLTDIGVVMKHSSDIARQTSDIILLSDNLHSLLELDYIKQDVQRKLNKNLTYTVGVNSSLILLGLLEILSPKTLALFHNVTTVSLVGSSLTSKGIASER